MASRFRGLVALSAFLGGIVAQCLAYSLQPCSVRPIQSAVVSSCNLVFCGLRYSDKQEFSRDIEALSQRLGRTRPFDKVNNITFWYIELSRAEEKAIFKQAADFPYLKVRQDFLDNLSSHLKGSYKLVIIDKQGQTNCAELSAYGKISLIILGKTRYTDAHSLAKGFLHELGHSLGLRDEAVSGSRLSVAGPPNCARNKEEAQEWWGGLAEEGGRVGYIYGCCGNKDYIRATIASLMNNPDKAEDFGPVNEQYLRKLLQE